MVSVLMRGVSIHPRGGRVAEQIYGGLLRAMAGMPAVGCLRKQQPIAPKMQTSPSKSRFVLTLTSAASTSLR